MGHHRQVAGTVYKTPVPSMGWRCVSLDGKDLRMKKLRSCGYWNIQSCDPKLEECFLQIVGTTLKKSILKNTALRTSRVLFRAFGFLGSSTVRLEENQNQNTCQVRKLCFTLIALTLCAKSYWTFEKLFDSLLTL